MYVCDILKCIWLLTICHELQINKKQWCSPRDRGLGLETTRDRFLAVLVLVLVLTLPVLVLVLVSALPVLDLVSKDWSRVFFETKRRCSEDVAKMPTGAISRTAAEHILSAYLTATSWTVHLHRRSHDPHSLHLTRRQPLQHWLPSHSASAPALYATATTGIHPGSVWTPKCQCEDRH